MNTQLYPWRAEEMWSEVIDCQLFKEDKTIWSRGIKKAIRLQESTRARIKKMAFADLCWLVLTCADWYWLMLTCSDLCWLVLTGADWCWLVLTGADLCLLMLASAGLCWLLLTCAEWCWLVLTSADWCLLVLTCADLFWLVLTCVDNIHLQNYSKWAFPVKLRPPPCLKGQVGPLPATKNNILACFTESRSNWLW